MEQKEKSFQEQLAEAKARLDGLEKRADASRQRVRQITEESDRQWSEFHKDMRDIAQGKWLKKKPGIPNLNQKISEVGELIRRSEEVSASQKRILDKLAANPLEEQCEEVYASVGQQLYALEQEELAAASEAGGALEEDERIEAEDERLEREGKPPPLHRVK
jgi:hypothetical protein